jgi:ABC-type bacteriocin/lantibiotic exporter with double-glycine peptidase domain
MATKNNEMKIAFIVLIGSIIACSNVLVSELLRRVFNETARGRIESVIRLLPWLILAFTIYSLMLQIKDVVTVKFERQMVERNRLIMADKLMNSEFLKIEGYSEGELIQRFNGDISSVSSWYFGKLSGVITSILMIGLGLIYLVMLSWELTALMLGSGLLSLILSRVFSVTVRNARKVKLKAQDTLLNRILEVIDNSVLIKSIRGYDFFSKRVDKASAKVQKTGIYSSGIQHFSNEFSEIAISIGYGGLFALGAFLVTVGRIDIGVILVYFTLTESVFMAIPGLVSDIMELTALGISKVRINEIFMLPQHDGLYTKGNDGDILYIADQIEFSYNNSIKPINRLSFQLPRKGIVILKGTNGSGKSTLLKILMGLYHIEKGTLTYQGYPLSEWSMEAIQREIVYVAQKPFLFSGTLKENVLNNFAIDSANASQPSMLPWQGCSLDKLTEICGLSQIINKLPNFWETNISEYTELSVGEQQRFCIARALARPSAVLLLDEAYSALDEQRMLEIDRAIRNCYTGLVINVTHRDSIICETDQILWMQSLS